MIECQRSNKADMIPPNIDPSDCANSLRPHECGRSVASLVPLRYTKSCAWGRWVRARAVSQRPTGETGFRLVNARKALRARSGREGRAREGCVQRIRVRAMRQPADKA